MADNHHQILIVGGGAAGIAVATSLLKKRNHLEIGIVEPSDVHYYQPGFTLVGAGVQSLRHHTRTEAGLIPHHAQWIQDRVETFEPDRNQVKLASGETVGYDYLVVCPGLQIDVDRIDGLAETLGKNGVCTNYLPDQAEYTWQCLQEFRSGEALFTEPQMPIKCPGAPQKILYLAADHFRRSGIADRCNVSFFCHKPAMFGVPYFSRALDKVVARYGIEANFKHNLVSIDGGAKTATFEKQTDEGAESVTRSFDMIHVTPPQSAPDFLKGSPLSNDAGFVKVDIHTLRHPEYENVFSLGDACATANSKTAAAVRKQSIAVTENLLAALDDRPLPGTYDGYASCPLTTSYTSMILAEFCIEKPGEAKVTPTIPLQPNKERYSYWLLKKHGLPWLYWDWMLRGREGFPAHDTKYEPRD